jgi:hypothetical protein
MSEENKVYEAEETVYEGEPVDYSQGNSGKKGFGIASLVLGICSVIVCCCSAFLALPCAIMAIIFGIVQLKRKEAKGMAIAGIILNTLHEQCDGYHQLYFSIFKTTRNGFFIGFPYICIGIAIAQHGILRSTRILWLIFLISINIVDIPFALFIAVYALFSLTLHMQLPSSKKEQYQQARLSSTVIYFVHMIWIGLITLLHPANIAPYWLFLWVMSLSSITAFVVVKNKNNKLIKWCFQ